MEPNWTSSILWLIMPCMFSHPKIRLVLRLRETFEAICLCSFNMFILNSQMSATAYIASVKLFHFQTAKIIS